ncbi:MAG: transcriptional antiterminator, Rof [Gammaproteobacteria bacterium]|nr:transcriptional antiterminator, Rof [Gammaproteobacteria bacterium]
MTDYRPVDCDLHSEYELVIMQRSKIMLTWQDVAGSVHTEAVLPLDLLTHSGEEFMVFSTGAGSECEIRLDHIRSFSRIHNNR